MKSNGWLSDYIYRALSSMHNNDVIPKKLILGIETWHELKRELKATEYLTIEFENDMDSLVFRAKQCFCGVPVEIEMTKLKKIEVEY